MMGRFAFAVAFAITYGIAGLNNCAAQRTDMGTPPESLQYGLALVRDQPDSAFIPVKHAELPPAIRSQAENYMAMYLTPEAQPKHDPEFKTRLFSTQDPAQDDLIEYRWTFSGVALRATQSLNALKVDIPLAGRARPEEVKALVASVVKLKGTDLEGKDYEVRPGWPDAFAEGTHFSSNPGASIRSLASWHDRLDAFVKDGRLSILIYKKIPQLATYQDGSQWFERYPPPKTPAR